MMRKMGKPGRSGGSNSKSDSRSNSKSDSRLGVERQSLLAPQLVRSDDQQSNDDADSTYFDLEAVLEAQEADPEADPEVDPEAGPEGVCGGFSVALSGDGQSGGGQRGGRICGMFSSRGSPVKSSAWGYYEGEEADLVGGDVDLVGGDVDGEVTSGGASEAATAPCGKRGGGTVAIHNAGRCAPTGYRKHLPTHQLPTHQLPTHQLPTPARPPAPPAVPGEKAAGRRRPMDPNVADPMGTDPPVADPTGRYDMYLPTSERAAAGCLSWDLSGRDPNHPRGIWEERRVEEKRREALKLPNVPSGTKAAALSLGIQIPTCQIPACLTTTVAHPASPSDHTCTVTPVGIAPVVRQVGITPVGITPIGITPVGTIAVAAAASGNGCGGGGDGGGSGGGDGGGVETPSTGKRTRRLRVCASKAGAGSQGSQGVSSARTPPTPKSGGRTSGGRTSTLSARSPKSSARSAASSARSAVSSARSASRRWPPSTRDRMLAEESQAGSAIPY